MHVDHVSLGYCSMYLRKPLLRLAFPSLLCIFSNPPRQYLNYILALLTVLRTRLFQHESAPQQGSFDSWGAYHCHTLLYCGPVLPVHGLEPCSNIYRDLRVCACVDRQGFLGRTDLCNGHTLLCNYYPRICPLALCIAGNGMHFTMLRPLFNRASCRIGILDAA
ncbi:hypothetical protein BX600DRAFT_235716 [Xylariales sp. PMI_506]|nr:hypothetical protein BX600DRAFT_235716 [Xylariales sp. PMI_506]